MLKTGDVCLTRRNGGPEAADVRTAASRLARQLQHVSRSGGSAHPQCSDSLNDNGTTIKLRERDQRESTFKAFIGSRFLHGLG